MCVCVCYCKFYIVKDVWIHLAVDKPLSEQQFHKSLLNSEVIIFVIWSHTPSASGVMAGQQIKYSRPASFTVLIVLHVQMHFN